MGKQNLLKLSIFALKLESGKVGSYLYFRSSYYDAAIDFPFVNVSDPQSKLESIGLVKNVFNPTDESISLKTQMSAIKLLSTTHRRASISKENTVSHIYPAMSFQ